jgi:hypothetical protein
LVQYAVGDWSCTGVSTAAPAAEGLTVTATVSASSASTGGVRITFPAIPPFFDTPRRVSGQWRLQSGTLLLAWDDKAMGTVRAEPIAFDAQQFNIKSDAAESPGKWTEVKVDRRTRSVRFDFAQPGSGTVRLTCRKT